MFGNILVPVDLSERNEVALRKAAELAVKDTTSLTLLHVIETIQDVAPAELEEFYRTLRDKAEATLERWASELAETGLVVRKEILIGRRGAEIIRYAEEQGCDLIVLTSHPLDRDRPGLGFGTISHQVAILARCPVLLMR